MNSHFIFHMSYVSIQKEKLFSFVLNPQLIIDENSEQFQTHLYIYAKPINNKMHIAHIVGIIYSIIHLLCKLSSFRGNGNQTHYFPIRLVLNFELLRFCWSLSYIHVSIPNSSLCSLQLCKRAHVKQSHKTQHMVLANQLWYNVEVFWRIAYHACITNNIT